MATIKIKFRASSVRTKEGSVYYQVIHHRVARQIPTGYKVFPSEWDAINSGIVVLPFIADQRRTYLLTLKEHIADDADRLKRIIQRLDNSKSIYTADQVICQFADKTFQNGLIAFAFQMIQQLKQVGKMRTVDAYTTTINSFIRFRGELDISLDEVDTNLMMEYETYLKNSGLCPNSSSFYMRNLRAIYNRAVYQELTLQRNPFKYVYTGIDKTMKRAITVKEIRKLCDLDLSLEPTLEYARDIFLFSFYTRGMSFIDMAYLKKRDLQNGILTYRRQKTEQLLLIRWEQPMQEIVNKYDTSSTPYLLPIIKDVTVNERRQYLSAAHLVNSKLKKIGELLDLPIALTTYVARHSWCNVAKSKNIPISVISEAMGHDSEHTTRIYLASLDTSVVDRANSMVLKSLKRS